MKIAVLGWGSLIWNPVRESGRLDLADDKWFPDGPQLPIEFARISRDRRLTLVICPAAEKVPVLWAMMASNSLDEAINNLRNVEGIRPSSENRIGYVNLQSGEKRSNVVADVADEIRRWARLKKAEAVIWTDLPPNFEEKTRTELTEENVIIYLSNLPADSKTMKMAEEYIRRAPRQIKTRLRSAIEKNFEWRPAST